ncbi:MAG: ATP-binding protein [Erysipelotrichaceae bacterium]|nr:ATP-binding protein [Erysipelotrichaceae bacterium]
MKAYLCELKVNGCKNIDKTINLKFCNSTIKSKVKFENTNVKAIYGPNGAGKSAIISAVHIYERLICDENGLNDSYFSNFVKESINKKTNKLEVEATVLFYDSKDSSYFATYRHYISFVIKNNSVVIDCEKISKLSGNSILDEKFKTLIYVEDGKIIEIRGVDNLLESKIYISSLNLLNKKSIVNISYLEEANLKNYEISIICLKIFALSIIVSMEKEDLHTNYLKDLVFIENKIEMMSKFTNEITDEDIFYFSVKDRDVVKVDNFNNYKNNINKLYKFIKVFKSNLTGIDIDKKINGDEYYCNKIFNYGDLLVDIEFESTGIKKLVRIYNALSACANGRIVFIDEFDANLHDVYFTKLVEFMKIYAKGQFCFTTHNLEPIDVLKDNSHSLDFLSNDSRVTSWMKNGNKSPMKKYINGLIDYSPFNVHAIDFIDSLLEEDN